MPIDHVGFKLSAGLIQDFNCVLPGDATEQLLAQIFTEETDMLGRAKECYIIRSHAVHIN